MVSGQWSVVSGQWSVVSGRWSVVGGRWSVVGGRWSVVGVSGYRSQESQRRELLPVNEPLQQTLASRRTTRGTGSDCAIGHQSQPKRQAFNRRVTGSTTRQARSWSIARRSRSIGRGPPPARASSHQVKAVGHAVKQIEFAVVSLTCSVKNYGSLLVIGSKADSESAGSDLRHGRSDRQF